MYVPVFACNLITYVPVFACKLAEKLAAPAGREGSFAAETKPNNNYCVASRASKKVLLPPVDKFK
jgi:hypothetical protein